MAVNAFTVLQPVSGETGIDPDARLVLVGSSFSGTGSWRERRWQVSRTNSFPASATNLVWDGQLRVSDGQLFWGQGADAFGDMMRLALGTTYYVSGYDRNDSSLSGAWATASSFTTRSDRLTAVRFRLGH